MMLAKPKPEESTEGEGDLVFSAPVPTTVPVSVPTTVAPPVVDTTDDREKELERRLAMLGNDVDDPPADTASNTNTDSNSDTNDVTEKKEEEDNLISFDKVTPVEVVPKEEPKKTEEPVVTKMAAAKPGSKSALLARIMAAQERAKQAQMKQTTTATKTPMTPSVTGMTHIPAPINVEKEKEKMMKALSGIDVFDNQTQEEAMKSQPPPTLDQLKAPTIAPPSVMAMAPPSIMAPPLTAPPPPAFMAPPYMASSTNYNNVNNMDNMPPPPSFEIFETQQQKMSAPVIVAPPPPPPAFDTIEQNMLNMPGIVPSAPPPPMEDTHDLLSSNVVPGFFDGMTPVAPPIAAPAPSFDQVMSQQHYQQQQQQQQQYNQEEESMDGFDFDIDGNALTPEERHKMMEEQRAILEQIQKQANENKASEAAVRATAFESRMSTNQQGHVVPTTTQHNSTSTNMNASRSHTNDNVATIDEVATAVDIVGFDPAEVEEQKKILEEIQKSVSKTRNSSYVAPSSAAAAATSNTQEQRTVDLGDGKKVALHGQDKTKDAIKNGTAILVQCVNCDNWMQVTQSATLMFCPICSVVSPVLKQDSVFTTEEALQLEEDRKLAERLQEEENGGAAVSDYPGSRSRNAPGSRSIKTTAGTEEEPSWWDSLLVNIGVSAAPDETLNERSAEVKVSHPPGSSSSTRRAFHGGTEEDSERLGLLGATSQSGSFDRGNPRAARVAESKPLFSCVVDSVSNAATTVGAGITSMAYGEDEEEVHGIDTTSFLAVPNIGDDRAGSGNYNVIPHDE